MASRRTSHYSTRNRDALLRELARQRKTRESAKRITAPPQPLYPPAKPA